MTALPPIQCGMAPLSVMACLSLGRPDHWAAGGLSVMFMAVVMSIRPAAALSASAAAAAGMSSVSSSYTAR